MLTIEYHDGAVTYLSDAGLAKLAAEAAAKAQSAKRNQIITGTLAGLMTGFALVAIIHQLIGA